MKYFPALLFSFLIFIFSTPAVAQTQKGTRTVRYMGAVELGVLYGKTENPWGNPPSYLASPSFVFFNGIHLHRLFAIGTTTGLDFYEHTLLTPIGLGVRGTAFNTRVSPFYSLDAGYGFTFLSGKGFGERPEGGWFINPAMGLRVAIDQKTAFLFGLGFKQQRIERELPNGWGNSTINQRITYKRLSLRIGFMF